MSYVLAVDNGIYHTPRVCLSVCLLHDLVLDVCLSVCLLHDLVLDVCLSVCLLHDPVLDVCVEGLMLSLVSLSVCKDASYFYRYAMVISHFYRCDMVYDVCLSV